VQSDFPALGNQYAWLTQYCIEHQVDDMRVCIEKSDATTSGPVHLYNTLWNQSEKIDDHDSFSFRVRQTPEHKEHFYLFGRYLLPLLDITKLEMAELAAKRGWMEIMKRTWYCHWPTRRGKPCGRCNPCLFVKAEGMGWRLPLSARIKSVFSKGY
jgi:7-cyano-7-deazaguanine synthase